MTSFIHHRWRWARRTLISRMTRQPPRRDATPTTAPMPHAQRQQRRAPLNFLPGFVLTHLGEASSLNGASWRHLRRHACFTSHSDSDSGELSWSLCPSLTLTHMACAHNRGSRPGKADQELGGAQLHPASARAHPRGMVWVCPSIMANVQHLLFSNHGLPSGTL